jgi:hypothetical protein
MLVGVGRHAKPPFDRENATEKPLDASGRLRRGKPELVETRKPENRWVTSLRVPETAAKVPNYTRCCRKTLANRDAKVEPTAARPTLRPQVLHYAARSPSAAYGSPSYQTLLLGPRQS